MTVHGKDVPWEENRFGKMKWYLHPSIEDVVIKDYIFFMMEIPPGSRSGRIQQQGNEAILILEGKGWTTLNGVKHEWKAGDMVGLPLRQRGNVVQHFNADAEKPARFVSARPNLLDPLGVDQGVGFEILEDAPREAQKP
jgi:quercetin dioxygenase-like cupin family protein